MDGISLREEGRAGSQACDLPVPCGRDRAAHWVQRALGARAAHPAPLAPVGSAAPATGTMKLALPLLLVTLALCCPDGECPFHAGTSGREDLLRSGCRRWGGGRVRVKPFPPPVHQPPKPRTRGVPSRDSGKRRRQVRGPVGSPSPAWADAEAAGRGPLPAGQGSAGSAVTGTQAASPGLSSWSRRPGGKGDGGRRGRGRLVSPTSPQGLSGPVEPEAIGLLGSDSECSSRSGSVRLPMSR